MQLTNEERKALAESRMDKAARAYEQAIGVADLAYWETAANRLYYAAFNAVSALLTATGDDTQTHAGTMQLFGQKFIKTEIFPRDMGKLYHKLFTLRQTSDYDSSYGVDDEDVLPLIKPTGEFIDQIMSKTKEFLN